MKTVRQKAWWEKRPWLVVVGLTLGVFIGRLLLAWQGFFPFTWDFGRDMLWVRQLTVEHKPMLVGAWGSLEGTFFGPAYFYFLTLPLIFSAGDPRSAVIMVILGLTSLIPLGYSFGKRWFGARVGWWWAILFALMPIYTQLSLYSFPQHLIPLFFFLLIASMWKMWQNPSGLAWFMAGFLASLLFHFEPVDTPIGYLSVIGWLVFLLIIKKVRLQFKHILVLISGLLIPLLPNLIYDSRHGWGQIIAFGRLVTGVDTSLGGGLPWWQRLMDRPLNLNSILARSMVQINQPKVGVLILVVGLGLGWWQRYEVVKKLRQPKEKLFVWLLTIISGVTVIYFIVFPRLLKDYYLYFVPVLITLALGLFISWLSLKKWQGWLIMGGILLILMIGQVRTLAMLINSTEAQIYRNQLEVVKQVYAKANGQPFKVYIYSPLIYDYPYQYLFWWWGNKAFGYVPVEYAYKPDQPEYVYKKVLFDAGLNTQTKAENSEVLTYLIMEPGDHVAYSRDYWRSLFPAHELFNQSFPGDLTLLRVK